MFVLLSGSLLIYANKSEGIRRTPFEQVLEDIRREIRTKDVRYVLNPLNKFLVQREPRNHVSRPKPRNATYPGPFPHFKSHSSYGPSLVIQSLGSLNAQPCRSCANGAGVFDGCVSFQDYAPSEMKLFRGTCANCFWGGQGRRCSLREGGPTIRSRRVLPYPLFQSSDNRDIHFGYKSNLNSVEGIRQALRDVAGLTHSLNARLAQAHTLFPLRPIGTEDEVTDTEDFSGFGSDFGGLSDDAADVEDMGGAVSDEDIQMGTPTRSRAGRRRIIEESEEEVDIDSDDEILTSPAVREKNRLKDLRRGR